MRKIYLLLLLCLLSFRGFSTVYYANHGGDVDNPANWDNCLGSCIPIFHPLSFNVCGDSFIVWQPMTLPAGHTWNVAGSVHFLFAGASITVQPGAGSSMIVGRYLGINPSDGGVCKITCAAGAGPFSLEVGAGYIVGACGGGDLIMNGTSFISRSPGAGDMTMTLH